MGKVFAGIGVSLTGFVMVLALIVTALATIATTPTESFAEDSPQTVCDPDSGESSSVEIPEEYQSLVAGAAEESGFSPSLIGAQIEQESNWDPKAKSPAGAEGIAQFMPGTWAAFGEGGDPLNPDDAIPALGRYMLYLREFMEDHADDEEEQLADPLLVGRAGVGDGGDGGGGQAHDGTEGHEQRRGGGDEVEAERGVLLAPLGGAGAGDAAPRGGRGHRSSPAPGRARAASAKASPRWR